jgi:sec-independent protein translocase protein TatB
VLDVNGWEFILLIVLAVVILGPERLPEYAAKLATLVRQARALAEGAKGQLREQMGPEFDDIDWRQYDPRQYDPRRIVREALLDPSPGSEPSSNGGSSVDGNGSGPGSWAGHDPSLPTPYDVDAT